MGTLTNLTRRDVRLPTRHVVPAGGALEIADETVRAADNWPSLCSMIGGGELEWAADPMPADAEPDEAPPEPPSAPNFLGPDTLLERDEPERPSREARLLEAMAALQPDEFTAGGVPSVDALNAALDVEEDRVTAAERDDLWATFTATQQEEG